MSRVRGRYGWPTLIPFRGHEQGGRRPVLILSNSAFNRGAHGICLAAPLTRTDRGGHCMWLLLPRRMGYKRARSFCQSMFARWHGSA
ncbi:MAG: hypothetical protein C4321_10765 [Chloroflexota bacterium]